MHSTQGVVKFLSKQQDKLKGAVFFDIMMDSIKIFLNYTTEVLSVAASCFQKPKQK